MFIAALAVFLRVHTARGKVPVYLLRYFTNFFDCEGLCFAISADRPFAFSSRPKLSASERALLAEALRGRDDSAMLVYADWLEEKGDRRAPYIRDMCDLAGSKSHSVGHRDAILDCAKRALTRHTWCTINLIRYTG